MNFLLTQSLLKDFADYKQGLQCGLQIEAKYFKGVQFESSAVQKLGQYFEYIATGALPKNGQVPVAERGKNGENKGKLTKGYQVMADHVDNFSRTMQRYGFKLLRRGVRVVFDKYEGTWDIEAESIGEIKMQGIHIKKGDKIIIDLKSTGLIDNKWDEMGWNINSLSEKEKLMVQALHYSWLGRKKYGIDYHFIFNVYSNTNSKDCKLIYVQIDPDRFEQHERTLEVAYNMILAEREKGFEAVPSMKECSKCPLNETCDFAIDVPLLDVIQY